MDEVLLRKAVLCRDRIVKIRGALPANPEELAENEMLEAFISFNLFLLIQDVVDLATHLVAERGLGIPGSQREVFETLAGSKLITRSTAEAMAALASLRNRIAHIMAASTSCVWVGKPRLVSTQSGASSTRSPRRSRRLDLRADARR